MSRIQAYLILADKVPKCDVYLLAQYLKALAPILCFLNNVVREKKEANSPLQVHQILGIEGLA